MLKSLIYKLVGIAAIALGGLILGGEITLPRDRQTIDLGVLRATAETRHLLPQWSGFGLLAAGVVLLLAGGSRRD